MKNKYDELEKKLEQPEPIYKEATPVPVFEIDDERVDEPDIYIGKPSFWDKAKRSIVKGTTFDFLRHFMIGFVGVGGTAIATTGNLGWALIAGVAGGLAEGGRKVWSGKTAAKNGGSKNRVLRKALELVIAIIEWLLSRRKEARDGN